MKRTPLHIAAVAALVAMGSLPTQAKVYSDSFTFATEDQSLWSTGAQSSWNYDSGFIGGRWGTYVGSGPVSYRYNGAMTGNPRTGVSLGISSSGQLGFNVKAGANGGGIDLSMPYQTTLLAPAPNEFVTGQLLRFGSSGSLANNARMVVDAPSFNASVNGIINTNNQLFATGCWIGNCSSSSTPININRTFSIIALDTTKDRPLTALNGTLNLPVVLGQDTPIKVGSQTVGHVTLNAPSDREGGTVAGNKLNLDTNQTILRTTADFGGIAHAALGLPFNVLEPSLSLPWVGGIGATLVNLQGGVNLGMSQMLSFDAKVKVGLNFDQSVFNAAGTELGNDVSFDLGSGIDLMFKVRPTSMKYSFSMGADSLFTNDTGISVDPLFAIQAGCFNYSFLGGTVADEFCAFEKEYATTDLLRASVYKSSFAVQGFNTASFEVSLVPEPQTWALLLAGLGFVGFTARRRVLSAQKAP